VVTPKPSFDSPENTNSETGSWETSTGTENIGWWETWSWETSTWTTETGSWEVEETDEEFEALVWAYADELENTWSGNISLDEEMCSPDESETEDGTGCFVFDDIEADLALEGTWETLDESGATLEDTSTWRLQDEGSGSTFMYDWELYRAYSEVESINTRLFTGREFDKELWLYYYRARYYDAELWRFISQDPIGIEDDINLYAYVGNNPVNFTDPSGEKAKVVWNGLEAWLVSSATILWIWILWVFDDWFRYGDVYLVNSLVWKNNIYKPWDEYTKTFMKSEDYTSLFDDVKYNVRNGNLNYKSSSEANRTRIGIMTLKKYNYSVFTEEEEKYYKVKIRMFKMQFQ